MEDQGDSYNIETWYGESMELRCLLKCMTSSSEVISDRIMVEQISRAKILLNQIQLRLEQLLVDADSEQVYEDASILLESLEMSTKSAVQYVSEKLERSEHRDDKNNGLLSYVFTDAIESDDELEDSGFQEITKSETDFESELESSISKAIESISKPNLTTEELQRQQEELLEEEISEMARQLKTSSLAIKSTLANQNHQLEEIESITLSNLDKTKDITDKVTEEVKRGWRKAASRWFIFIIILGTWMFCFLTIRVVPKRKNACLFFCRPGDRTDKSEEDQSDTYENRGQYSNTFKDISPKYSFCTEKGSECTSPMDSGAHVKTMEKLTDDRAEDVAFDLANQLRWDREQEFLIKAQQEHDQIASKRVQEGWKSAQEEENNNRDGEDYYDDDDDDDEDAGGYVPTEKENMSDQSIQQNEDGESYSVKEMLQATVDNHFLTLRRILKNHPEWASIVDDNGWQPIHEAAHSGSIDALRILVEEYGADVNSRTGIDHKNGSVLWWTLTKFESNHPIVTYLRERGAVSVSPNDTIDTDDRSEL